MTGAAGRGAAPATCACPMLGITPDGAKAGSIATMVAMSRAFLKRFVVFISILLPN
jgi:hypothetical protein